MRMEDGAGLAPDAGAGAVTGAILDRLDSIGRLLAEGGAAEPRRAAPGSNLGTRIDMLGRIVEQVLADREADEARLAALARRIVELEAGLAPALAACTDRLDAALPLLAGPALEAEPAAPALALVLSGMRDALDRLAERLPDDPAPRERSRPPAPRGGPAPDPDAAHEGARLTPPPAPAAEAGPGEAADDALRLALAGLGEATPPG